MFRNTVRSALLLGGIALVLPACGSSGGGSGSGSGNPGGMGVNLGFFYSDPGIETFPDEGHTHVPVGTVVTYYTDPPTSGNHYPNPQAGGYFEIPIAAGFLVHSMEHGGVIVYYDPAVLTTAQKNALKALAAAHPGIFGMIVCVPRTDPTYPLILTAWTHRLRLGAYDQARIDGFLGFFLGEGPESPWGDPVKVQTTVATSYSSGYLLQVTDTGRPGSMIGDNDMVFMAQSTTSSIELRASAASALADTQAVRFLSESGSVLSEAVYDASTGTISLSIGSKSLPAVAVSAGSYHLVSFAVDSVGTATWSVDGSKTAGVAFGNPVIMMEFAASYAAGPGTGPEFSFRNPLIGIE